MPQLSPLEILVVAVVALVVFGPEKLPEIARTVGGAAARARRMAAEFREEFETSLQVEDDEDDGFDDLPRPSRPAARPARGGRPGGIRAPKDATTEERLETGEPVDDDAQSSSEIAHAEDERAEGPSAAAPSVADTGVPAATDVSSDAPPEPPSEKEA